eukprot:10819887-Ditylum_brightwellii.AAC.1
MFYDAFMRILEQSWWKTVLVYPMVIPMGGASEVVLTGYDNGLPFGVIVGGYAQMKDNLLSASKHCNVILNSASKCFWM